ncbi:two-component system response regulator QseB [Snodgrassella communis]|uniref:Two-component system response regulator QseB n=1 Tax=Snodgrassella communis TaxID=2946699 RepID=A0A836MPI7_9NEIS|nr:response regulator [Snodgrassella communis]KDN13812.1 Two-component system response regulator QseB [Snodgrassella communis]PIT09749.1 two-component system response regulator QseB [Snodgrassella communis]PIT25070.1 two-component system response regulator QseB [Snodgrassella communis]PIT25449.1 two-component system response regulator QseB [Snodgrassella communis]PIT32398.1 two-component system response regulator QseB [Snodgrassella communis]
MRILILEDDSNIADGLNAGLNQHGIVCDIFASGRLGEQALSAAPYDAVILDLSLAETDGMEVLQHWRNQGINTPVLILTARDALPDRLAGLNASADDYLGKPFALDEVIARLHALIRRSQGISHAEISFGQLSINLNSCSASLHGQPLNLTQREWLLLQLLVTHPQHVFSRAQIEDKLYNWEQEVESNAVEVHVHHLRKKIGTTIIRTRRGLGYQLGEVP